MTLDQIVQRVISLPQGAVLTDETRFGFPYVITLINTARAQVIQGIYFKNKRIHPACYQTYYADYDADLQEDDPCVVKFKCPASINLDSNSDGFRYVGQVDGKKGFRRVTTRAFLSTYNQHPLMQVQGGNFTAAMWSAPDSIWEVYNSDLKYLRIEGIFANPLDIPTYNKDVDDYPVSVEMLPQIEDFIFKTVTAIEAGTQPDYVSNGVDTTQQLQTRRR